MREFRFSHVGSCEIGRGLATSSSCDSAKLNRTPPGNSPGGQSSTLLALITISLPNCARCNYRMNMRSHFKGVLPKWTP